MAHTNCANSNTFLKYVLGLYDESNVKADQGNVVHKVLECLAKHKKCQQDKTEINDDEVLGNKFMSLCLDVDALFAEVYKVLSDRSEHDFTSGHRKECLEWTYMVLDKKLYDPRRLHIKDVELYFDFELPHDWARFDITLPNGEQHGGQIGLKGTVDLIIEHGPKQLEIVDWKTGRRWDWAHDHVKNYRELFEDFQLMLYYYAVKQKYPDHEIVMTINWIKDGGPFTLPYNEWHEDKMLDLLQKKLKRIQRVVVPQLIHRKNRWKCKAFCYFGKHDIEGNALQRNDPTPRICDVINKAVKKDGINNVMEKYGDIEKLFHYGEGGGTIQPKS